MTDKLRDICVTVSDNMKKFENTKNFNLPPIGLTTKYYRRGNKTVKIVYDEEFKIVLSCKTIINE